MGAFENIRNAAAGTPSINELHGNLETQVRAHQLQPLDDWYFFTLVRDPIRRFLSFYSNKVLNRSLSGNLSIGNPQVFGYRTNMSLDEAIDVAVGRKFEPDAHVLSYSEMMDDVGFELNFIGRVEEFESAITRVHADTGTKLPVFHLNKHNRIPLFLNRSQFDRLSEFYREDQARFGYNADYDAWCDLHVAGDQVDFQTEEGFEFEDEAKLLHYEIQRIDERFRVRLTWRVHPNHSRARFIRVLSRVGNDQKILHRLPENEDLGLACNDQRMVSEIVEIPLKVLEPNQDKDNLCIDIYFWDEEKKKARLLNFAGGTRLVLPLIL